VSEVNLIYLVGGLELLLGSHVHPQLVAFAQLRHEQHCFTSVVVDDSIAVSFLDSEEVPESGLLFDYVIDVVIVLVDIYNAFEETDGGGGLGVVLL